MSPKLALAATMVQCRAVSVSIRRDPVSQARNQMELFNGMMHVWQKVKCCSKGSLYSKTASYYTPGAPTSKDIWIAPQFSCTSWVLSSSNIIKKQA